MTDRIDPGPGWRLLVPLVDKQILGDQYLSNGEWNPVTMESWCVIQRSWEPRRRRIPGYVEKAIATRATVRAAFRDGRIVTRMERNDSGLGEKEMRATIETWNLAPLIGVKYVMLEIQREGEP